jgi:hypothetical protein
MQQHSEAFILYNGLLLKSIETIAFNEYLPDGERVSYFDITITWDWLNPGAVMR